MAFDHQESEQMDLSGEQATPIDLDKPMSDIETEPPVSVHDREYREHLA